MTAQIRHAAVIGGATGIGSGVCKALVARGYHVHLCDIDLPGARALAAELGGDRVTCYETDVTSQVSLTETERAIRTTAADLAYVFINAGAISLKRFLDTTDEDWQWLLGINFFGTVRAARTFLPGMLAQDVPSRLLVTSSVAALRTPPMEGQTMYMASKSAQLGLCNGLRTELEGTSVGLSVIFPGAVRSSLRAKSESRRPGAIRLEVPARVAGPGFIEPAEAGERIVAGAEAGRPFITTHPDEGPLVREAQDRVMTAFAD